MEKVETENATYFCPTSANKYYCNGHTTSTLLESGIKVDDGRVISEGRIVEIARELHRLLETEDYEGFCEYYVRSIKELSQEEQEILKFTRCSGVECCFGLCCELIE